MTEKLKRLNDLEERILSCVAIGDCRGALKGPYSNPFLEITCPMRDHGPGFEAFFARGRFTIARALLNGKIEPIVNFFYQVLVRFSELVADIG